MKRIFVLLCGAAIVTAWSHEPVTAAADSAAADYADHADNKAGGRAIGLTSRTSDYREVTIPTGTVLPVRLETSVGSDISRVEQPVHGALRRAIRIGGVEVLPAGTAISGHVTAARRPGRVKGRGMVAMRFNQLDTPGDGTARISTATVARVAPATKEKDTLEIIAPAAGGAVLGRVMGGKSGAAKGAVIGGAAGTGYVLSTRGKEVRLGRGAWLSVRLTAPVTVRVPDKR